MNERAGEKGESPLVATMLSRDHKPDDPTEVERVEQLGTHILTNTLMNTPAHTGECRVDHIRRV